MPYQTYNPTTGIQTTYNGNDPTSGVASAINVKTGETLGGQASGLVQAITDSVGSLPSNIPTAGKLNNDGTPAPVTPTNTGSSDVADARKAADAKYIADIQAGATDQQKAAEALLNSQTADAQRSFEQSKASADISYNQQEGTTGVVNQRLGLSGSSWANNNAQAATTAKLSYYNNLAGERDSKIAQLKAAYQANDFKLASEVRDQIYKITTAQQDFLQNERQSKMQEAKALLENEGLSLDNAKKKAMGDYQQLGNVLFNTKTGEFIAPPETGGIVGEYANYKKDEIAAGRVPMDQLSYIQAKQKLPSSSAEYEYYKNNELKAGRTPLLQMEFEAKKANYKLSPKEKEFMLAQQPGKNGTSGFDGTYDEWMKKQATDKLATGTILDDETIDWWAKQYLSSGKMPPFGMSGSGPGAANRAKFLTAVSQQQVTPEQAYAQAQAKKGMSSAYTDLNKKAILTKIAEEALAKNADLAIAAGESFVRPSSQAEKDALHLRVVDAFNNWLKTGVQDPKLAGFALQLFTVAREYAKVSSGNITGSGITDSARKEAEDMLNPNMSQEELKAAIAAMKLDANSVTTSMQDGLDSLQFEMGKPTTSNTQHPSSTPTAGTPQYTDLKDYVTKNPAQRETVKKMLLDNPTWNPQDVMNVLGFNNVGGDTNTASKVSAVPVESKGGQCGRFVNNITGLGVGDSYQSKLAKMDPSLKPEDAEPGMIFTMPYEDTGHIGFIVAVNGDIVTVKDSNWYKNSDPETVHVHDIPLSKITGLKRLS